jgi:hypothetical protein
METDADVRAELYLVWGVKANDYQGRTMYEFGTAACDDGPCGEVVWDGGFDPSPPKVQKYLREICYDAAALEAPGVGDAEFVYDESISLCLMDNFKAWLAESSVAFPIDDEERFWGKMYEYLQPPTDEDKAGAGYEYVRRKLTRIGKEGTRRMYFLISAVETTFKPALFYSIPDVQCPRDAAYAFEAEQNANKPEGATDFFVSTSSGLFTSMRMQQAYVSSTLTGVMMALGLALASLLLFVSNVIVAFTAFVCIAAVVCCTLGLMVMIGWSIGPIEAIWCARGPHAPLLARLRARRVRLYRSLVRARSVVACASWLPLTACCWWVCACVRARSSFAAGVYVSVRVCVRTLFLCNRLCLPPPFLSPSRSLSPPTAARRSWWASRSTTWCTTRWPTSRRPSARATSASRARLSTWASRCSLARSRRWARPPSSSRRRSASSSSSASSCSPPSPSR